MMLGWLNINKLLLIFFVFVSTLCKAQCGPCISKQYTYQPIVIYNLQQNIKKTRLLTYKSSYLPIKLTVKTTGNFSALTTNDTRLNALQSFDLAEAFDGLGISNFTNFDIRLKIYASKKVQLKLRCLVIANNNLYTAGIIVKP